MGNQAQATVQAQQKTVAGQKIATGHPRGMPLHGSILQHAAVIPAITSVHSGILQRCSGGVECPECRQKRLEHEGMMQRAAVSEAPVNGVPPIMHEVLGAPGQPLDGRTRAFMEPRFGHDFSQVRVHSDAKAAESTRAVNALAYTVGRDVVFGERRYEPGTNEGRKLLAHELTHTIQQSRGGFLDTSMVGAMQVSNPKDVYEQEADQATEVLLRHSGNTIQTALFAPVQIARQQVGGSPASSPGHIGTIQKVQQFGDNPSEGETTGAVRFNVRVLSPEEFLSLTGLTPDQLSEDLLVSGSLTQSLLPGTTISPSVEKKEQTIRGFTTLPYTVGLPAALARFPSYPIPPNATGILWTQLGAGHLSVFGNVGGEITTRGFRYDLWRNLFSESLSTGVPGTFKNDLLFTLLPTNQTIVYRATNPDAAEAFVQALVGKEYTQTYRFPPRAGSEVTVCGSNCITVPAAEIEAALGGLPEILTQEGAVNITQVGRQEPGAPFEPGQAGRGATVREYLRQEDISFAERGLVRTKVPTMTLAARGGVGFIKVGGILFMVYGAYRTEQRLEEAWGTEEFPVVAAEEAGGWGGGILGTAIGGAIGGAIACAPGGPVDLICVAGGFIGGLIFGALGGHLGATLGRSLFESGGTPCPSCHAMQRAWEKRRPFIDFGKLASGGFGATATSNVPSISTSTPTYEDIELLKGWIKSSESSTSCPSCHAMQRAWEKRRPFIDFSKLASGVPKVTSTSDAKLRPEDIYSLKEWLNISESETR